MKIENILKYKYTERNSLIDARKKAKKEKDADAVAKYSRLIAMADNDILSLESRQAELAREYDSLSHRLGKIRLDLYMFADIIYNSLIEYEDFRNQYVINKDGDNDVIRDLNTAINAIKKLPFEMAENEFTNNFYCAVTEKFMDRWKDIRDGVTMDVLREVDKEFFTNKN